MDSQVKKSLLFLSASGLLVGLGLIAYNHTQPVLPTVAKVKPFSVMVFPESDRPLRKRAICRPTFKDKWFISCKNQLS